jgi:hypothetical protein
MDCSGASQSNVVVAFGMVHGANYAGNPPRRTGCWQHITCHYLPWLNKAWFCYTCSRRGHWNTSDHGTAISISAARINLCTSWNVTKLLIAWGAANWHWSGEETCSWGNAWDNDTWSCKYDEKQATWYPYVATKSLKVLPCGWDSNDKNVYLSTKTKSNPRPVPSKAEAYISWTSLPVDWERQYMQWHAALTGIGGMSLDFGDAPTLSRSRLRHNEYRRGCR